MSDPVAKTLKIGLLGQIEEPVSTLPQPRTIAEAITALVTLLHEANMVAGRFEPDDLVTLGFKRITTTLNKFHKHLGKLVGIKSAPRDVPLESTMEPRSQSREMTLQDIEVRPPPPAAVWNTRPTAVSPQVPSPPPAQDAADSSSQGSSTPSHVGRMPLGPAGAALLQARARDASSKSRFHEMATRGQPPEMRPSGRLKFRPDGDYRQSPEIDPSPRGEDAGEEAPTDPVGNLQAYFDAAMARFLQ